MSQPLSALLTGGPDTPPPARAYRLLAAQRLAEAVEAVHASGGVIGNLDDHRVLVAPDGTVTLRDEAGTAMEARPLAYAAPELQGSLTGYARLEAQHDTFALAVLLFQLLMDGHHPYAGQWVGGGNLPDIPKAIQLGLYAHGGSSVTPPPGAPALSTLEPGLADLFKRSFGATSAIFRNRPTGAEWARALTEVRETGQAGSSRMAEASRELPPPGQPVREEPSVPVAPAAPTAPVVPDPVPDSTSQVPGSTSVQSDPLPVRRAGPTPRISTPAPLAGVAPLADVAPIGARHVKPETPPGAPAPNPPEPQSPGPAVVPEAAPQQAEGKPRSPGKRKFSRRSMLERVVPPANSTGDPSAAVQPDRSEGSVWGDLVEEFRWLAAPDQYPSAAPNQSNPSAHKQPRPAAPYEPGPSDWDNLVSEIRWFVESDLHWLTDPEFWRRFGKFIVLGLLFLIWLAFGRRSDDPSNRGARPAVVRSTRVPATQTPRPQPTATRVAIGNPTVASFGTNFDVADEVIPSAGEMFIAQIRNKALRLEAFGKDARGTVMFNAAPAQGDFNFTMYVGSRTGQGEMLIYLRKLESGRTWVFAVDPGSHTWGLYEDPPWTNQLTPVIAHQDYRDAIGREPLRTVTVARKGGRTSLLINGVAVQPTDAGTMPRIGGPVAVGVGAMTLENPKDYDGESFVVTIDRVAMRADED